MPVTIARLELLGVLGGAAAWPLSARAQPSFLRLGELMGTEPTDAEGQARLAALRKALGLLILRRSSGGPLKNTHIEMFAMQIVQLKLMSSSQMARPQP